MDESRPVNRNAYPNMPRFYRLMGQGIRLADLGLDGGDAVELFVERARAAGVQAPLDRQRVGALCASLDGMALAIELAAARCRSFGLDGLIAGLDRGLRMLGSATGSSLWGGAESSSSGSGDKMSMLSYL